MDNGNYGIVWKRQKTTDMFAKNQPRRLRLGWISLVLRDTSSVGLHVVFAAWRHEKRRATKKDTKKDKHYITIICPIIHTTIIYH